MNKIFIILSLLILTSCATTTEFAPFENSIPFSEEEVSWAKKDGITTVYGSSYILDRMGLNGTTHTCVGYSAWLIPDSEHNREYLNYLFSDLNESFWNHKGPIEFKRNIGTNAETNAELGFRESICGVDGKFSFSNVPDGTYYLNTTVYYIGGPLRTIPPNYKGGMFIKKVVVSGQEEIRVVLTL